MSSYEDDLKFERKFRRDCWRLWSGTFAVILPATFTLSWAAGAATPFLAALLVAAVSAVTAGCITFPGYARRKQRDFVLLRDALSRHPEIVVVPSDRRLRRLVWRGWVKDAHYAWGRHRDATGTATTSGKVEILLRDG
jgi:hypothetical protein